ncbi:hypothetical protein AT575_05110 [Streptococcus penaeicida]|uniref:HAD family hydrolase n=1 Tax=Streptococcus penaeicida TaxID=1765960 RepID=A0A2N8LC87_9STRE|nr:HAD family phosphatase [Streptococcus penaeicida]PND47775.1 hypothetical protein AT575_05110 [Streptococcus penaeicida]
MQKIVFFDLDGVLFDSYDIWDQMVKSLLERYGIPFTDELQAKLWSLEMDQADLYLTHLLADFLDETSFKVAKEEYLLEEYKSVTLKSGTKELLPYLIKKGYNLYAVTSNYGHLAKAGLEANGLLPYFQQVISTFDYNSDSKDIEFLNSIISFYELEKHSIAMVEDSWKNLLEAKKAGIETIYLLNDVYPLEKVAKETIDFAITDLDQLSTILR